jgi:type VI secretion system secreted protein Hcp
MANVAYYLKIQGIDGESEDANHKGEIEVQSWSWGETNSGSFASGTTGGGTGKVAMQDFHFTMPVNKASPNLMRACADGTHIDEATLSCQKFGGKADDYLTITFRHVLISSYQTGGSPGDVLPSEQISFNFAEIEYEYKQQNTKGGNVGQPVVVTWNLAKHTK